MKQSELVSVKSVEGYPMGRGYSLRAEENKIFSLFSGDTRVKRVDFKDAVARRLFIVDLVKDFGFPKLRIHKATGVSRQTIDNNLDIYDRYGKEGLIGGYSTKDGNRIKARKRISGRLKRGNKARLLEQERREKREEAERKIMALPLVFEQEAGSLSFSHTCESRPCRYAGNFIYSGILEHMFGFGNLLGNRLRGYGLAVWLYVMMLVQKIPSVEQLKTVFPEEFGLLLGMKRLPSKPRIWFLLTGAYRLNQSALLLKDFFLRNVRAGLISVSLLFIDGHFVPYSGKEKIHKGYSTQRRLALPGRTLFTAFDHAGRYIDSLLHEGTGDYIGAIKEFSAQARKHLEDHAPIIIGDREMWGVDRFLELIEEKIDFITWEKGTDGKKLEGMEESLFRVKLEINETDYSLHEEKKTYRSSATRRTVSLRRIVIWNKDSNKRMCLVSNVENEAMEWLALLMLNRWGISENGNKRAKHRWNVDYSPGYRIKDLSAFQDIPNPKLQSIQKRLADIEKKRTQLSKKIAHSPVLLLKDGRPRRNRVREKNQREFDKLTAEMAELRQERSGLPKRIPVTSLSERAFRKIDSEAKQLYQVAHAAVFNAEKHLVNLLKGHYSDPRDCHVVLDMIRNCYGWVTITENQVRVVLEPLAVKRYFLAQKGFLTQLNSLNLTIGDGKRLTFDVGNQQTATLKLSKNYP